MKSTTVTTLLASAIGFGIVVMGGIASAQVASTGAPAAAAAGNVVPELVTLVYPVADLVFTAPNYPFQGISVPGTASKSEPSDGGASGGAVGGFGGGGFGGGGGGGRSGLGGGLGGGGFNVVPEPGQQLLPRHGSGAFSVADGGAAGSNRPIDRLAQAIQISIRPEMWSDRGGPGSIVALGDRLIITQSKEIHEAIRDLLVALRSSGGARSTVTVRAWWLRLDMSQYQRLLADMPASSPPKVNRTQLEQLAADRAADYAEITCFDGQTVHVISGRFRNAITSVIPVVGQAEPPHSTENQVQLAASDSHGSGRFMFTAFDDGSRMNHKGDGGSESLLAMAGDAVSGGEAPRSCRAAQQAKGLSVISLSSPHNMLGQCWKSRRRGCRTARQLCWICAAS